MPQSRLPSLSMDSASKLLWSEIAGAVGGRDMKRQFGAPGKMGINQSTKQAKLVGLPQIRR